MIWAAYLGYWSVSYDAGSTSSLYLNSYHKFSYDMRLMEGWLDSIECKRTGPHKTGNLSSVPRSHSGSREPTPDSCLLTSTGMLYTHTHTQGSQNFTEFILENKRHRLTPVSMQTLSRAETLALYKKHPGRVGRQIHQYVCDFRMSKLMMEDESDGKKKELDFFIRMIILLPPCLSYYIISQQSTNQSSLRVQLSTCPQPMSYT